MDNEASNKELAKKSLVYLVGNFSSKILQTLIIPIYAFYLSAEELGEYDFQQTVASLLMPLLVLAIWEGVLRHGLGKDKGELSKIITSTLVFSSISLLISAFILAGVYSQIYGVSVTVIMYVVMIVLYPLVSIFQYISRAIGKNMVFVQSSIISAFINVLALLYFVVHRNEGLTGLLISYIISQLIIILTIAIKGKVFSYISFSSFSLLTVKELLIFSSPLVLNLMFGWLVSSFSRFYINLTLGATANGIFAFANKFAVIIMTVSNVINMAAIEDAVLSVGKDSFIERFESNIFNIFKLLSFAMIMLMPVTGIAYHFIDNPDYLNSLPLVPILSLSVLLSAVGTLFGNIFTVYNKTNYIFVTTLIGVVVNVVSIFILGNIFGLIGIVCSQLLGSFAILIVRYRYGRKIQIYGFNWTYFCGVLAVFTLVSYLMLQRILILNIAVLIVLGIIFLLTYKKVILDFLHKFKLRK